MRWLGTVVIFGGCLVGMAVAKPPIEKERGLKVGQPAPTFESTDDQGNPWKSSDHVGKKILVVYFYPADLTGGCTAQACGFRDAMSDLTSHGIEVVGVSGDAVKNHQLFKKVKQLPFTLLADENGAVAKAFGVPLSRGGVFNTKDENGQPVSLKRGVTIARWTYVIDKDGKILYRNMKVSPAKDSKEILALIAKQEKGDK